MSIFEAEVIRSSNSSHPPSVSEFTSTRHDAGMNAFAMITLSRAELTQEGGSVAAGIDWYERWGADGQVERVQPEYWVRTSCVFIENVHRVHFILVTQHAKGVAMAALSAA